MKQGETRQDVINMSFRVCLKGHTSVFNTHFSNAYSYSVCVCVFVCARAEICLLCTRTICLFFRVVMGMPGVI